ncbi:unnamed protein product [Notodromas monacha]|uniref:Large ribosomal subunit protein mL50 n=1 Tax=Notodromas monacha TaxID=399045 RepID=A0A7R9BKG5_9CRUS|nr:unnamed protein product [Notodromas monacha]CAG0916044.1 unnamed protein product [Notodromas monacha]
MIRCSMRVVLQSRVPVRGISFFKKPAKKTENTESVDLEKLASQSEMTTRSDNSFADGILPRPRQSDFDAEILAARGFLRNYKPYRPPVDVDAKITQLKEDVFGVGVGEEAQFPDLSQKWKFLHACDKAFNHRVPNSMLHRVNSPAETRDFYKTEIDVRNPLEMTKDIDLPPNLHVIHEPTRFHPQTDTMFGGVSAFPGSSTIVTGLKARLKYAGYKAKPRKGWLKGIAAWFFFFKEMNAVEKRKPEYGVHPSTISTILAMKKKIMMSKVAKGMTKVGSRSIILEEMEKLLAIWINDRQIINADESGLGLKKEDLSTEELQQLLHDEDFQGAEQVLPSMDEKGGQHISIPEIKKILKDWENVQGFVEMHHPNLAEVITAADIFDDTAMKHFRQLLKTKKPKQTTIDAFFKISSPGGNA